MPVPVVACISKLTYLTIDIDIDICSLGSSSIAYGRWIFHYWVIAY